MRALNTAIAICVFALVSGCTRIDFDSPSVRGRIIDQEAGSPIAMASVSLKERPKVNSRTDANGQFTLPAVRETSTTIPWADMIVLGCCSRGTIVVEAIEYKTLQYPIRPRDPDQIDIMLKLDRE